MSDRTVQLLIGLGIALAGLLGGGAGTQLWQGPVKPASEARAIQEGLTRALVQTQEQLTQCREDHARNRDT